MYILKNIKLPYQASGQDLQREVDRLLGGKDIPFELYKKSLDARKGVFYVYQVLVKKDLGKKILRSLKNRIQAYQPQDLVLENKTRVKKVVIVGTGPSGLFAGYILSQAGVQVHLIDQGEKIQDRVQSVQAMMDHGILNPQSNIQFGEGGAGTFSDGKLTSRSKDKRSREVFKIFVENGAPEDILYEQMPHIGTDILRAVIVRMRKKIESLGGTFHFQEKFTDLVIEDGKIQAIKTDKTSYQADHYILALGNSARDTFSLLDRYISLEQKPFAVGFRIEHLRQDINLAQYKIQDPLLPQASYQLNYFNREKNLSVYSFCMCPGGYVVPASSEENRLCVNGMSYHDRMATNSNSAIVMAIDPKVFGSSALAGMDFQRKIEEKAYQLGGGDFTAPVQRLEDFFLGRPSQAFGKIQASYQPQTHFADLNQIYPEEINQGIKEALLALDKKLKGFAHPDALLTGVETRTSSPVRLLRKDYHSLEFDTLHPIGEGAGYAGGIVSSALDGLKCALQLLGCQDPQDKKA